MGFHYAYEKKKFDARWRALREYYTSCGMAQQAINALYEFDWAWFCSQRSYENRTQELPGSYIDEDAPERNSSLFRRFQELSVQFDENSFPERYAWIETVEDDQLRARLASLSQGDLELLTLYAIEGYSQPAIARRMGCCQSVVSRKLARIRNFLI